MTTPYYQDSKVTLWLGDCREVTDWLAADVLVADPPYGIGWKRGDGTGPNKSAGHQGIANDDNTSARDLALESWGSRPAAIFGSFYATAPTGVRHVLVWEKHGSTGVIGATLGFRRDIEAIYLTGTWPRQPATRGSVLRTATRGSGGELASRTGHPHTKPLDVMEALIEACPPGVIADPFAGSGSTLVAARNLGRRAIGVEIHEPYAETIAKRLAQDCLDLGGVA